MYDLTRVLDAGLMFKDNGAAGGNGNKPHFYVTVSLKRPF